MKSGVDDERRMAILWSMSNKKILVRGKPYNYKVILSSVDREKYLGDVRVQKLQERTFEYFNDAKDACERIFTNPTVTKKLVA